MKLVQERPRTWRATCQFRDFDGKVRKVSRWQQTKTQAANKLREAIRDRCVQGADISPNSTIIDVYTQWMTEFRALVDSGNRSGTSIDTYDNRWNKLLRPRVERFRICELTAGRVDRILQELNTSHSASTARTCRAILSGVCGVAVRHGALRSNPIRDARPVERARKHKHAAHALTIDKVRHIFTLLDTDTIAIRQDLPDITRYLAGTGNRTGETLAIRWESINFTTKQAQIQGNLVRVKGAGIRINDGKTPMANRTIPLTDWLVDLLRDRRQRIAEHRGIPPDNVTGWVFPNRQGGPREANNLRRDWRAFRNRHNLEDWYTPYTLRRTVATLITDKLPARHASDLLGHSTISQTIDTYIGRTSVAREPADILNALGDTKNASSPQSRSDKGHPEIH